ncbi:2'-5' RNA ligase family protein [Kribbella qitaiheensis]|uniref:2'-5' RNA ligase family protein n=1 Tax=Kribbella qitaiheensis TaxID=1544730 RepID=A0A7G6WYL3_9ACTN|nr:2'-5' RNA ligase family protein [Kribbella qitaiheensis]QNE19078.1 2'-5' RNA ligase family protein [Kribbella qitaiheensis]
MIDEVRDHWYLRPGWRVGRSFYTWHLTFADSPSVADLADSYADVVARMPGLTPVTPQWLHLTMQGVGFTDRVPDADLTEIIEATKSRLSRVSPFEVTIGPAVLDAESLQLPVAPVAPLQNLRDHLRAAIGDAWGPDAIPELPHLTPHISLGYWNRPAPAAPLATLLSTSPTHTATTPITAISLIALTRTTHLYTWTPTTTLTLS